MMGYKYCLIIKGWTHGLVANELDCDIVVS